MGGTGVFVHQKVSQTFTPHLLKTTKNDPTNGVVLKLQPQPFWMISKPLAGDIIEGLT